MNRLASLPLALLLLGLTACSGSAQSESASSGLAQSGSTQPGTAQPISSPIQSTFTLSSAASGEGGLMGQQFTCDGAGISPPLAWTGAPAGTRSFAVTMHHVSPAGQEKHVYMVVYGLPAATLQLGEGSTLGSWGLNTVNGKTAYTPPCSKGPGRKDYILTVYALSASPDFSKLTAGIRMDDLLSAIKDTTLATATLTLGYARP
jgi:phosphatidylethanolamine-binding protein (PEBP) family uncharacterized protein